MYRFTNTVIKTSSKVQISKKYNQVINILIQSNKQPKAINKKL